MSGKTGETCTQSGVYRCSSHPSNTIPIAKRKPLSSLLAGRRSRSNLGVSSQSVEKPEVCYSRGG